MNSIRQTRGFTLVELLVVLGIISVLIVAVFITQNPKFQFAETRNAERFLAITAIRNAIDANTTANNGNFTCTAGPIPESPTLIESRDDGYNILPCLVPTYLETLPIDPHAIDIYLKSATEYRTGFIISRDPVGGTITIAAPHAELGRTVSVTR